MDKPIILAVDDEPTVLAAVARDLRHRYGSEYRILRASGGAEALETLRQLRLREDPVALLLVDQRMPEISGVEMLAEAIQLHPAAKRVLLTAYADTDAAISAINEIRLDHYLMKPWDPPEERLYPVLTDLLDDWRASFAPRFDGVTVIGHRWSNESHRVKDFLASNLVPYRWLDIERDAEARQLIELARIDDARLPILILADGSSLVQPTSGEIAERVGLRTRPNLRLYDLVIVGGGPAGLAAAVYGASEGLRTLLVESRAPGGQAGGSSRIENYLGFPVGLSGGDLTRRAVAQATRFGAEILTPLDASGIRVQDSYRFVSLSDGSEVACRAVLITTGVTYRKLEIPGADRLTGMGVYYGAAITEALECRGQDVVVVGGGNSAGQSAMYLSNYARTVTLVVRSSSLSRGMSRYLIDQIQTRENITVRTQCSLCEVGGDTHLEFAIIREHERNIDVTMNAEAVFVFIGAVPHTDWIAGLVERDAQGFILSGPDLARSPARPASRQLRPVPLWLETSVPGIFVAGDVRHRSIKRIASAVGEGAMAVQFIHQYLGTL